jgi:hypothetical protein
MEHLKKTKPRILNSISSKITNKIFKIRGFKESKIINEWNEIVGEEISDLTLPIGITKDQKLKVLCNNTFALEFQHLSTKIINRINLVMGYKAVKTIQIIQSSEIKKKTQLRQPKQQLTKKQSQELARIMDTIENLKIKNILSNLSKTLFSKKSND